MTEPTDHTSHGDRVPGAQEFEDARTDWRRSLGSDSGLRERAVDLQVDAERHHYTYTWQWLGVPIIRLPDDICTLQELVWEYRPDAVVETGVARGGSMILNASLQVLAGLEARVLGIDLKVHEHTRAALVGHPLGRGITILESDSTFPSVRVSAAAFLDGSERALLILDSNHTHDHVYRELVSLAPLLPVGSFVLVADTLIEEFPAGHFADRPWDRGNNPLTAVRQFLAEHPEFELDPSWSRRGLLSEFRDGILRKVG